MIFFCSELHADFARRGQRIKCAEQQPIFAAQAQIKDCLSPSEKNPVQRSAKENHPLAGLMDMRCLTIPKTSGATAFRQSAKPEFMEEC